LPPSATHIGNFQNFVFAEADLIGIIGIGLVAVNGFGTIRILGGWVDFLRWYWRVTGIDRWLR